MNRIVILLIASFALVNCQSNGTSTATTINSITTESAANLTTAATTLTTNQTSEPTTQNVTTPVPTTVPTTASTPTPTTPPKPSEWNGTVTKDNNTCINVKFAVEIKIKYNNTNNTEVNTGFNIPVDAQVDEANSYCSPNSSQLEVLVIRFDNEEYTSANLTLRFNETSDNVFVQQIELSYILTRELFPSYNNPAQYNTKVTMKSKTGLSLFSVAKVHSYVCDKAQTAPLDDADSKTNGAQIEFTESKVQAFIDKTKNGKFDSEINCKSTEISDVVPIAVGAALAGLVVIVLIAYFIGRRRSRRLAYQSV